MDEESRLLEQEEIGIGQRSYPFGSFYFSQGSYPNTCEECFLFRKIFYIMKA
jgi:hypothetical protein